MDLSYIDSSNPSKSPLQLSPLLFALGLALLLPFASRAQELITDRPDFTESGVVVPAGSVQLEAGVTWADEGDGVETSSGPELLVRWGLSERFELRLGLPDRIEPRRGTAGFGDGSVGVKWQLGPTVGGWDVGLIGTVTVPVGDVGLTSDSFDPDAIFTIGRELSGGWSFGTQVSAGRQTEDGTHRSVVAGTLVLGRGVGERASMFIELAAEEVEGNATSLLAHHGYTWLLRPFLQFDAHVAVGLSDEAPDTLAGFGVSWRR